MKNEDELFRENYFREMDNDQLTEVLKNRADYQPEAAGIAIREAIARGLIHSEDDLSAETFQPSARQQFSLFPSIPVPKQARKTFDSLIRIMLIAGVLPVVVVIFKLKTANLPFAVFCSVFTLAWELLIVLLSRKRKPFFMSSLFVVFAIGLLVAAGAVYYFNIRQTMDLMVIATAFLTTLYGLIYLKKILLSGKLPK